MNVRNSRQKQQQQPYNYRHFRTKKNFHDDGT